MKPAFLAADSACLLLSSLAAGEPDGPAKMLKPGDLLVDDPLNESTWAAHWEKAKGRFTPAADHFVAKNRLSLNANGTASFRNVPYWSGSSNPDSKSH